MIIDCHAHACGDFLLPETIIGKLDMAGADKVILVPGQLNSARKYPLPDLAKIFPKQNVLKIANRLLTKLTLNIPGVIDQIPEGNEYVYNLCRKTNGRALQFVWITQRMKNVIDYLNEKYKLWNFKGLKIHQCWRKLPIKSDFFLQAAGWAEEHELPLFIHLYSDKDVRDLIEYKRTHPKQKIIVGHLFGIEVFIKYNFKDENLFFDISPYQFTSIYRLSKAINFFGASHVVLGSDSPYGKNSLEKNIEKILRLDISDNEKELILGENMRAMLKPD